MPGPVRILSVEDSQNDYDLILRHLRREGWQPVARRVENAEQMRRSLAEADWDVILSDFVLPGFSATAALDLNRRWGRGAPFLIVSGQIDEETAVRAMREGAKDYILKDRLARLGPALEREIAEARARAARRSTEAALERSEARFQAFVANSSEGIGLLRIDPPLSRDLPVDEAIRHLRDHTTVAEANRALADSLGRSDAERVVGLRPPFLDGWSDRDWATFVRSSFRLERHETRERPRGEVRDFLDSLHAEKGDGEPRMVSTIWWIRTEVTTLRRIEEALRRQQAQLAHADRMISLGTLVSGVAHEINNPNQSMMLNIPILRQAWRDVASWLDRHGDPGERLRPSGLSWPEAKVEIPDLIDEVLQGTHRIRSIVQDLRAYSREDSDRLGAGSFDPNEAVRASLRLLSNTVARSTRCLEVDLDDTLSEIPGSLRQIEQVVVNVLLNACQSLEAPDRGIRVSTRWDDEERTGVLIEVRDQGAGIATADLARITDPFFTRKRDAGGSGLGLAVSSRIVDEHAGNLRFESAPGEGTTVRLRLPAHRREGGGP